MVETNLGMTVMCGGMQKRKPYRVSLVNRSSLAGRHMLKADSMVQSINALEDLNAR